MTALATGLTLLLFFGIVRELYDSRVAGVALLLAAISPTTVLMGASLLSQPVSRLCMAAFLYAILRIPKEGAGVRGSLLAAAAGFAIGYGFNTRPLVALVFGVIGAGYILWKIVPRPDRNRFVGPALCLLAAGLAMFGLYLAWNAHLTGDPWLSTYHALQKSDQMGFGLRGEGYAPLIKDFRIHFTPGYAFIRFWVHSLPCVLLNTVGWGWYDATMFFPSAPHHLFPWLAPVLLVPLCLLVLPFVHRSRRPADVLCGLVFALTAVSLFFQYSDHASWGATPVHCSYYNEATLFGLIPLLARGVLIVVDEGRRRIGWVSGPLLVFVGSLLAVNTLHSYGIFLAWLGNWDPFYQRLPGLVAAGNVHHAVVFVSDSRNAPLGDYPFKPLDQADLVYFRLGPFPQWGLTTNEWRVAYDKYFAGREAYIYDGVTLHEMDTGAELQGGP
jgi:4-amino-4-deoxy-L-arabinose transferase-like glycosyltransferase